MPTLKITPAQFGFVVSVYAFSAGASGLFAAGFADRFDRKKLLLFFYTGFIVGTLLCGLAPDYPVLVFARLVTGLFGGVIGSITLAISTDLFSYQQRGRVMGFLQTAFAGSQILGLPIGLYFSNLWGWHAPFLMIVAIGLLIGLILFVYLKPIDEHLELQKDSNALSHFWKTLTNPRYAIAFAATGLLSTGGFMLMPFGSAFMVNNMKISMDHLPFMYLVSGLFTMLIGPLVGRASDRFGKFKVFLFGAIATIIALIVYTNRGETPVYLAITINVLIFAAIFSRVIPAQALISSLPSPANRGAFMAVNGSLQQVAGGIASVVAGLIVVQNANGPIEHFDTLGYIICGTVAVSVVLVYILHKRIPIWNAEN